MLPPLVITVIRFTYMTNKRLDSFFKPPGTEEVTLVVLQDYPSNGVSEPTYRVGEKLRLLAQYDLFFFIFFIRRLEKQTLSSPIR